MLSRFSSVPTADSASKTTKRATDASTSKQKQIENLNNFVLQWYFSRQTLFVSATGNDNRNGKTAEIECKSISRDDATNPCTAAGRHQSAVKQLYVKIPSADRKTEATPDGTGIAHQGFSVRVEAEKEGEKELNKPYSSIKMNTLSSRSILLNPNNQVLFVLPESYARVAGLDCTNFSTMQSENIVKY
ncbi:hypothetical protein BLNAU_9493 [Blattamonas nauphoetae]|uniref:Uncharacterized protein n=1 Tax=Blattamonas nauphoetae TaxID=2049346 RepID=A0ABQ9XVX8_9EUKA|nr:hypothetical protein BLNAU_24116 [Blattamonas nauphoetae]KAK2955634.1 hypothetical protein BLNAU_9493 [Blattamonas nauphoetae]